MKKPEFTANISTQEKGNYMKQQRILPFKSFNRMTLAIAVLALTVAVITTARAQTYTSLYEFNPTPPEIPYSLNIRALSLRAAMVSCILRHPLAATFALPAAPCSRSHPRAYSLFTASIPQPDRPKHPLVA